jgi:predicted transposase YdaD
MLHHFHFGVIKLWEVPSASLLEAGLPGLLPLLPLSREGKRRQTIDAMISGLCPPGEAPNGGLLSIAYGLASLVFEERDEHEWLKRRFFMLEELLAESWVFREWREKALEEGLKQGLQQGEEKGRKEGRKEEREESLLREIQRQRQILLAFVQARFPSLTQLTEERCKAFDNPEQLQTLILDVGLAQSEQEVRKCLFDDK